MQLVVGTQPLGSIDLDLNNIGKHGILEHDVSISRLDFAVGDNRAHNPARWAKDWLRIVFEHERMPYNEVTGAYDIVKALVSGALSAGESIAGRLDTHMEPWNISTAVIYTPIVGGHALQQNFSAAGLLGIGGWLGGVQSGVLDVTGAVGGVVGKPLGAIIGGAANIIGAVGGPLLGDDKQAGVGDIRSTYTVAGHTAYTTFAPAATAVNFVGSKAGPPSGADLGIHKVGIKAARDCVMFCTAAQNGEVHLME
ncbi:hypothetical protein RQP46_007318 [Phenoliferia psychrophenolica]